MRDAECGARESIVNLLHGICRGYYRSQNESGNGRWASPTSLMSKPVRETRSSKRAGRLAAINVADPYSASTNGSSS